MVRLKFVCIQVARQYKTSRYNTYKMSKSKRDAGYKNRSLKLCMQRQSWTHWMNRDVCASQ